MKEVRVEAFCDGFVGPHPKRTQALIERNATVDGQRLVFDFCVDCDAAWVALRDRGTAPEKPNRYGRVKKDLGSACNQCDYVGPTRSALGQHMKSRHSMTLSEAGA